MIFKNDPAKFDLEKDMPYHVDIERLRKGKVGGFFWYAYISGCERHGVFTLPSCIGPFTHPAPIPKRRARTM